MSSAGRFPLAARWGLGGCRVRGVDARPAIDLYCGLGGWTEAFLSEGYRVFGFDIERHEYGEHRYPGQLVIQDVRTLHGSQFRDAGLIVASPPCTEYSYMAMPWTRAKQIARALRDEDSFPDGYTGSRTIGELNELFDACFRIQREACEAAGRHIPLIVENVRGAQPWVGRARWNYGSFYLWGDVPALMPAIKRTRQKGVRTSGNDHWERFTGDGFKSTGMNWSDRSKRGQDFTRVAGAQAAGVKNGSRKFPNDCADARGVHRKAASALIAKIPEDLARHIAMTFREYQHGELL